MKKIIMASVAIVVAAVAAQAQSPRVESAIMRDCLMGAFSTPSTKNTTATSTSIQNAVERAVATAKSIANDQSNEATQAAPQASPAEDSQKTDASAQANKSDGSSSLGDWLKALFLAGPRPGENQASYDMRLKVQSYPAVQPYK